MTVIMTFTQTVFIAITLHSYTNSEIYQFIDIYVGDLAYIADAAISMVDAIVRYSKLNYAKSNGDFSIPPTISGVALAKFLRSSFNVTGVTGTIKFSSGNLDLANYGQGDREYNVVYEIVNFNSGNGSITSFSLDRVGSWLSEAGYQSCESYPSMNGNLTGGCRALVWGTGVQNMIPQDRKPPINIVMPALFKNVLFSLSCILFVLLLFFGFVLVRYRTTRLLRASQIPMMWIVLLSTVYACIRIISAAIDNSSSGICRTHFWTGHLAFTGVIALFAKTLRVHLIVNSKMKKVKISSNQVLAFTIILIAVMIVYMLVLTGVDTAFFEAILFEDPITGQNIYTFVCTQNHLSLNYVLYAYEALVLLLSLKVCFDTRNVPDAINESKYIAKGTSLYVYHFCFYKKLLSYRIENKFCLILEFSFFILPTVIFIVVIMSVIAFALIFSGTLISWQNEFLIGISFFMSYIALSVYYFGPKSILLLSGIIYKCIYI